MVWVMRQRRSHHELPAHSSHQLPAVADDAQQLAVTGVLALLVVILGVGCVSMSGTSLDRQELIDAINHLNRPTAGDMAALYDLRVARSGGFRMSMITAGGAGRLTISEPFGAAVSLTAWEADSRTVFFDMEEGCRREVDDLEDVLGVGALPLEQAARLLGGRLPAVPGDEVRPDGDGVVVVLGAGSVATIRLASDPWRVMEVWVHRADREVDWHLELSDHTSSVPGKIRLEDPDGKWAELELKRLEWPDEASLPDLPAFPPCGG